MNHFAKFKKPEKLKELFLPFFGQFVLLVLLLVPNATAIKQGHNILEPVQFGEEITKPTSGRLIYTIAAFIMCILLSRVASSEAKKGKVYAPFFIGSAAGTLLWQAIGENMWHFGLPCEDDVLYFVRLESCQSFNMVFPFIILMIYCVKNHSFDWGMLNMLLSFCCNLIGHYVSLATYPVVSSFMTEEKWIPLSASAVGIPVFLLGLYLGLFSARDTKARLTSSMIMYIGVGIVSFGFIE